MSGLTHIVLIVWGLACSFRIVAEGAAKLGRLILGWRAISKVQPPEVPAVMNALARRL